VGLRAGSYFINEKGRPFSSVRWFSSVPSGRATGAGILRKLKPHCVLGTYAFVNVLLCGIVTGKAGLDIGHCGFSLLLVYVNHVSNDLRTGHLRSRSGGEKGIGFIVMAIIGGAIMPKLMVYLGRYYNMSVSFLMPMGCFSAIAAYGYLWSW